MIVLAVIPPLWRRVMDPRLVAHRRRYHARDIHPPARERILRTYGADVAPRNGIANGAARGWARWG